MGFNFPNAPSDGTVFAPVGGPSYVFSNGVWKLAGGGTAFVVVSDTAPPTPFPGQLWWESDTGALFFWYVDANSSQWVQINFTPSNSGISNIVQTVITTSGTYVKPASLKFLQVEGVGAGAGAAGANATSASQGSCSGGAGAGAWGIRLFAASELAASVPYTIGAAGVGTTTAGGGGGGTTDFGGTLNCTLAGGGGSTRTGILTALGSSAGGLGGVPGAGWTVGVRGSAGGTCYANLIGAVGNMGLRPAGGISRYGTQMTNDLFMGNGDGSNGTGYGSGGTGSISHGASGTQKTGGDGTSGMLIFTEYF